MADTTADEYFPDDTFHAQWTVFWLLAIAAGWWLWVSFFRPAPVPPPPRAAISAGYDWFLILHLPEIPNDKERALLLKDHFAAWLAALEREDFHPMLLSDVERRASKGVGLPERAVVLVFEPAYYRTYDALSPILRRYRVPALWVSDHTALLRGDRHFIHRHQAASMRRSGYWDLGYTGDGFWGTASDPRNVTFDEAPSISWAPDTNRGARNWLADLPHVHRLDVSPKWSADDLIMRLEMELPIQGPVHLGARRIQNHFWGVVMTSAQKSSLFSLQAPFSSTETNLYWYGTRGASDVQVDISIPAFFGQVSLWLRSDRQTGQGVRIGFTHRALVVDQKIHGVSRRLASVPWTPPSGTIKGRVLLHGSNLNISIEGTQPISIALSPEVPSPAGIVRLGIYDRVRGAASAEFVNLTLTPLSKPPH